MPRVARTTRLPEAYRVIVDVAPAGNDTWSKSMNPWRFQPSEEDEKTFSLIRKQSITSWGRGEKVHPINFFEQVIECKHCGYWRSPTTPAAKCCQNGLLVLNHRYKLGDELLDVAERGISKVSAPRSMLMGKWMRAWWV